MIKSKRRWRGRGTTGGREDTRGSPAVLCFVPVRRTPVLRGSPGLSPQSCPVPPDPAPAESPVPASGRGLSPQSASVLVAANDSVLRPALVLAPSPSPPVRTETVCGLGLTRPSTSSTTTRSSATPTGIHRSSFRQLYERHAHACVFPHSTRVDRVLR